MRNAVIVAALLISLWTSAGWPAELEDTELRGRVELGYQMASEDDQSLSAYFDEQNRGDGLGDLRLMWEPKLGHFSLSLHYELSMDAGDTPVLTNTYSILEQPATWFNLSNTFIDHDHLIVTQRLDRAAIGYTDDNLVLRLGRQALTWGSGIVFNPMDLFDPFSPNAIDTEYKPGADMAYLQWLFEDGSDVELVAIARPLVKGDGPSSNASSYAAHFQTSIGPIHTTWLIARDRRDWTFGVGASGGLDGAAWNVELVPTVQADGPTIVSMIANISQGEILFGHDVTPFVEYFRNGFGTGDRNYHLFDLPETLLWRLVRGQVFNTGRDYLAAGATIEATPLLTVKPTLISNIDDASLYGILQVTYSLTENLNLVAGADLPIGPHHTEFGGIALSDELYFEQAHVAYIQLRQYF